MFDILEKGMNDEWVEMKYIKVNVNLYSAD